MDHYMLVTNLRLNFGQEKILLDSVTQLMLKLVTDTQNILQNIQ